MLLEDVPLLDFLAKRPHPVWVTEVVETTNPLDVIRPHWHNAAYAQLDESGVEWQQTNFNLRQRCLAAPADPEACSAATKNWILTATALQSYIIVTATRRPDADIRREQMYGELTSIHPPIALPEVQLDAELVALWSRTHMGRMVLEFPWHTTPLGPIADWSDGMKTLVNLTLEWPERLSIWLGDEMIAIYNDNYIKALGHRKHERALGRPYKDIHPETWEAVKGYCYRALAGEVVYYRDNLLLMDREPVGSSDSHGLEETYHIWSFVPIRVGERVVGFVNESTETTSRVIAERRAHTLRALGLATSLATTQERFFSATRDVLNTNAIDFPFVIMYTVQQLPDRQRLRLALHSALGVPEGHAAAPAKVSIRLKAKGTGTASSTAESSTPATTPAEEVWPFMECITTRGVVHVPELGKRAEGLEQRGWDQQCESAVMFAVNGSAAQDAPALVVVAGMNPCRPFDDNFRSFIDMLEKQISSGLTTVQNFEVAQRKAEELASIDRAKTAFVANISHELRTPLTLIMGPLEDILSEPGSAPLQSANARLKVVLRHARRLHQLVNSLLDFARLEAGRYLATFRPIDVGMFTADIASLFRSAIERGGVRYVVDCQQGKEAFIDTDAWEKVVTNIISNAFKYCLEGQIHVRVEYTKTEAVFSCADTGCGIPASDLGSIFNRFHRVESVGARSVEGTGVGLALTYETVKTLGGDIDVQSEVGVGSTFTVRLPLGTAHIPPERLSMGPEAASTAGEAAPMRYGMRLVEEAQGWLTSDGDSNAPESNFSERESFAAVEHGIVVDNSVVLIADDNADLRHYCVNLLSPRYIVKSFPDGQAALDYVLENDVDLVLSDVQMPRMDGYAFLRAIRSRQETTLIPFILLSAAAGIEARAEGLYAGADDYLVKPFASRELLARVKTHLELGKMRRDLEARVQDRTRLLVESETRLLQQIAESEHMRKQQEIVVDLTSHELRNPLNAIWQNADLIQAALGRLRVLSSPEGRIGVLDEAQDAVQNIVLSVAHQTRIADDILNFSKISMSLLTIHRTPFHLYDTVQNVLRMWELETREHDIRLELNAPESLRSLWVNTDPHRCSQILINFLTNAIRFTSDSPTRTITVFLESFEHVDPAGPNVFRVSTEDQVFPDGFWLRIGVQDSGSGLGKNEREKLFERFAQAHPSKDQFSGGHGLGLFVSRHIVMLLGGYIDVESTKGAGSTFSFAIPVEPCSPTEGYDRTQMWRARPLGRSSQPEAGRSAVVRTLSGNMRARHVLVVEDNTINQKVLTRQLQAKGFHTSVANDGQEALDCLFEGDSVADIVLMDIEMPVKDGKTACRELREREAQLGRPPLPAIAVTGNAREAQIQECLDAGFDDVAIKPYRIEDLISAIDRFLAPTRLPTALAQLASTPTSSMPTVFERNGATTPEH